MPVTSLATLEDFNQALKNLPEGKLMVVDFTAAWCGPCQIIKPKFSDMSIQYRDVLFYMVDVDANDETAEKEDITAMPTFKFYLGGKDDSAKCVDKVVGGAESKIREKIDHYRKSQE